MWLVIDCCMYHKTRMTWTHVFGQPTPDEIPVGKSDVATFGQKAFNLLLRHDIVSNECFLHDGESVHVGVVLGNYAVDEVTLGSLQGKQGRSVGLDE